MVVRSLSLCLLFPFYFYSKTPPPPANRTKWPLLSPPHKISPPPPPLKQAMSSTMTTPKRPRSPTSTSTTSPNDTDGTSTITHFLSSVRKSVTKRMRIGYDYLGGGGTTNGQTGGAATTCTTTSAAAATAEGGGGADNVGGSGGTTPHAHRAALPRKEFGATPAPGGIGSPPFASPPFASTSGGSGPKATKSTTGSGSGSKKITRFADGKKTTDDVDGGDGKLLVFVISWVLYVAGFELGAEMREKERGREVGPEPLDQMGCRGIAPPRKRVGWREIPFSFLLSLRGVFISRVRRRRRRRHRSRNESLSKPWHRNTCTIRRWHEIDRYHPGNKRYSCRG